MVKNPIVILVFSYFILCGNFVQAKDYTLQELYQEKAPLVVQIISHYKDESRTIHTGAGFFVSKDGLIATAAHVIHRDPFNLDTVMGVVVNRKTSEIYDVVPLKVDLQHDVALLKITHRVSFLGQSIPKEFNFLELDNLDDWVVGDRLTTIGNPSNFFRVLTEGIVSADEAQIVITEKEDLKYRDMVITTLLIYPGNSGGPVFNLKGQVVGVLTLGNESEKLAFFQKAKYVQRLLDDTSDKIIVYEKEKK